MILRPTIQHKPEIYHFQALRQQRELDDREDFSTSFAYEIEEEYIPTDFKEFFHDLGPVLYHPGEGHEGELVTELADYQYEIANNKALRVLVDKGQKTGISTSELIHDFQEVLLYGNGKDMLLVAQTATHAKEHLRTLRDIIDASPKYSKYLITDSEGEFKSEKSTVGTLFIRNPKDPHRPSRIIARGFNLSQLWSWKTIFRIHVSDASASEVVDDAPVFAALISRLTNTNGRMMIEGPPAGPFGKTYEWYEQFKDNHDPEFVVFTITIYDAQEAGLVTPEFIEKVKVELGPLFPLTYLGSFEVGTGDIFDPDKVEACIKLAERLEAEKGLKPNEFNPYKLHLGGVDYGPAKITPLYIAEVDEELGIVRLFYQEFIGETKQEGKKVVVKVSPLDVATRMHDLHKDILNLYWYADAGDAGFINTVKDLYQEDHNWDPEGLTEDLRVRPVHFRGRHKDMMGHLVNLVSQEKLAIPRSFKRFIISLLTAKSTGLHHYDLDKKRTKNDDDLDDVRLLLEGETGIAGGPEQ